MASTQCARSALIAAGVGLVWGSAAYAVTGTAKTLVSPGLDASSPLTLLVAPPLIASEGMLWGLLGGAMYLLPPAFFLFVVLAQHATAGRRAAPMPALAIGALLFLPVYVIGLRGHPVDGALIAFSVWYGVRAGLRELERRLETP